MKKAENTSKTGASSAKTAASSSAKTGAATTGAMAVIMTGGKQYKVRAGDTVKIEKLSTGGAKIARDAKGADYKVGDKVTFSEVLLLDNAGETSVGEPHVKGASVEAEIREIGRDAKVTVIHYKQKSKYFKKYGHRQPFMKVAITKIS